MGGRATTRRASWLVATALVVGNMIGTGVFTSLGFQVAEIPSPMLILVIWLLGGLISLCGGLCYAELASALPRSGGEYHLLTHLYHPLVGFLAGWVSLTVGFAAPVALSAMAFGAYSSRVVDGLDPQIVAVVLVLAICLVFLAPLGVGSRFLGVFVALKVAVLVTLSAASFGVSSGRGGALAPQIDTLSWGLLGPAAIALIFVLYSYSGWNASIYIVNEVREPKKNVPRSIVVGTAVVTLLYLALNAAFLYSVPLSELAGELEVGLIAARFIFGRGGGDVMALLICVGLVSSIAAMTWAGPRVAMVMGEDYPLLRPLAKRSRQGVPYVAVLFQTALVLALILSSTFEAVLTYMEVLLIASSSLTVAGVFVLRARGEGRAAEYRTWGYPWTPLVFLAMSLFVVTFVVWQRPVEAAWGVATLGAGVVTYLLASRSS